MQRPLLKKKERTHKICGSCTFEKAGGRRPEKKKTSSTRTEADKGKEQKGSRRKSGIGVLNNSSGKVRGCGWG